MSIHMSAHTLIPVNESLQVFACVAHAVSRTCVRMLQVWQCVVSLCASARTHVCTHVRVHVSA